MDDWIPFWPAWVWIYLSAYFLDTAGLCLAVWGISKETFRTVLIACYVNLFIATIFHLTLPFEAIKPAVAATSVSDSALAFVQRLTTRWNTFPSLHVSYSLITAWAAAKGLRKRKLTSILVIGNAALIIPATLLVKEHTVMDVCGGVMLAALSLMVAMASVARIEKRHSSRSTGHQGRSEKQGVTGRDSGQQDREASS